MRRGLRLLGAVALACASVPAFGVAPAHADSVSLSPSNHGYFFQLGIDKPDVSPATPPNVGNDIDGVATGHLAVAALAGQENKVSFLYFDVFDVPADASVSKAVVSLPLIPLDPPNDLSFQAAPEKVVACMAGDEGFSGDDAVGIAKAPKRLCDKFKAVGKASADGKAYEFDVTALAQGWLSGVNDGVAFTTADTSPAGNFQVVFDSEATLNLTYSGGTSDVDEPPLLPDGSTGGGDGSTSGGGTPPLVGGISSPPLGGDPGTVGTPGSGSVPPVTTPQGGGQPTSIALAASSRPTNQFWVGGLAVAVALLLISLVCGDPRVAAHQRKTTRLAKALTGRRTLVPRPVSW
jgi:hypothetical protein